MSAFSLRVVLLLTALKLRSASASRAPTLTLEMFQQLSAQLRWK